MTHTRARTKGRRGYGLYYNVPHSVAGTPAYRSLSVHAFKLWHDMLLQYNGSNNGRIDAILSRLENRSWKNSTLYRSLNELKEKGFIVKTRQGGIGAMSNTCCLYRFTHLATGTDQEIGLTQSPPTNDYQTWQQAENKTLLPQRELIATSVVAMSDFKAGITPTERACKMAKISP